jgi:hypothetical protein
VILHVQISQATYDWLTDGHVPGFLLKGKNYAVEPAREAIVAIQEAAMFPTQHLGMSQET